MRPDEFWSAPFVDILEQMAADTWAHTDPASQPMSATERDAIRAQGQAAAQRLGMNTIADPAVRNELIAGLVAKHNARGK